MVETLSPHSELSINNSRAVKPHIPMSPWKLPRRNFLKLSPLVGRVKIVPYLDTVTALEEQPGELVSRVCVKRLVMSSPHYHGLWGARPTRAQFKGEPYCTTSRRIVLLQLSSVQIMLYIRECQAFMLSGQQAMLRVLWIKLLGNVFRLFLVIKWP